MVRAGHLVRSRLISGARASACAVLPFLLAAVVALTASSAAAQTTNGVIAGVVTDAQGGVLPGVTVIARNAETGFTRTVVTEGDGRYRLAALPPGRW